MWNWNTSPTLHIDDCVTLNPSEKMCVDSECRRNSKLLDHHNLCCISFSRRMEGFLFEIRLSIKYFQESWTKTKQITDLISKTRPVITRGDDVFVPCWWCYREVNNNMGDLIFLFFLFEETFVMCLVQKTHALLPCKVIFQSLRVTTKLYSDYTIT